MNLRYGEAEAA